MKCVRCNETVTQDMQDQVADNFDHEWEHPICWDCATEVHQEREQDQSMNNPVQDGPAAGEPT